MFLTVSNFVIHALQTIKKDNNNTDIDWIVEFIKRIESEYSQDTIDAFHLHFNKIKSAKVRNNIKCLFYLYPGFPYGQLFDSVPSSNSFERIGQLLIRTARAQNTPVDSETVSNTPAQ